MQIQLVLVGLAFGLIFIRLFYLQVSYGSYYRELSENNRIRIIRTQPPRGEIFDREGRQLVRNRPAFNLSAIVEDIPDKEELTKTLAEVTGFESDEITLALKTKGKLRPFEPRIIKSDITREIVAKVEVNSYRLPGIIIQPAPTREYPQGDFLGHVLGYTREVSKEYLEKDLNYKNGDFTGFSGIEKVYEDHLRGINGEIQVEVDARGNRKKEIGVINDEQGENLTLTIDIDLQKIAEDSLKNWRGAVVAIDPRSGEILALASAPSIDPSLFATKIDPKKWETIANDPFKPLTNRAISSAYPPGSTFKLFAAAEALFENKITSQTTFNCPGYFKLGRKNYKCHKHGGHGIVDLRSAIMMSCNVYFYNVGQMLDLKGLEKLSRDFGFGKKTGIDLQAEEVGFLPSEAWKRKIFKEKWYPGDTVPVSIGQGLITLTPIQLAVGLSGLVNNGLIITPHLIKLFDKTPNLKVTQRKISIDPQYLNIVKDLAVSVVEGEKGTGKKVKLEGVHIGGKTGTAQVSALGKEHLGDKFKDHAWFIGYAPASVPEIVVVVIVENSGHGGEFAAPIAHDIFKKYFEKTGLISTDTVDVPVVIDTEEGYSVEDLVE